MALYRTYRPSTFAEVVGQDHVTEPLRRRWRTTGCTTPTCSPVRAAAARPRRPGSWPDRLNCEQGPTPEPCGECQSCRDLARGRAGQHRRHRDRRGQPRRGRRRSRPAREGVLRAGVVALQGLHHRRGAHGLDAGLQRAAQAGRGAAPAREVRLRDDRAGEGPADDPIAHASLPVPARPVEDPAAAPRACLRAGGRGRRAGGARAGGPGGCRQRPRLAVRPRPAHLRLRPRRRDATSRRLRCWASPTRR